MNSKNNSKLFSLFKLRNTNKLLLLNKAQYAYAIYKNKRVNLLDGIEFKDSISYLKKELKAYKISDKNLNPTVFHLYYELGYIFENICDIQENDLLAIIIFYKESKVVNNNFTSSNRINLKNVAASSKELYTDKFNSVQKNLMAGNCYQLNLTEKFTYKFNKNINYEDFLDSFFSKKKSLSAYAHATYIESIDQLILSNSPECLFSIVGDEIITMPIKGTTTQDKKSWQKLLNSKKEQSELFMITDLMRNDLTRIALTPSKVVFKKAKLVVPKIWHQYSQIKTKIPKETNLLDIISKIFPGGSITGAPKNKAMQLLQEIETVPRGIYCGSTIVFHKSLRAASINIRTADISFKSNELSYGSGGGITLLSETNSEYEEMFLKLESFLLLFD